MKMKQHCSILQRDQLWLSPYINIKADEIFLIFLQILKKNLHTNSK